MLIIIRAKELSFEDKVVEENKLKNRVFILNLTKYFNIKVVRKQDLRLKLNRI